MDRDVDIQKIFENIFTKGTYEKYILVALSRHLYMGHLKFTSSNNNISDLSLHPIISFIGTYNYNLAKLVSSLLEHVIPATHCTKDSCSFCEEIKKVRAGNTFLFSYVCSLFTSIPLTETIDIAVYLLFEKKPWL